MTELEKLEHQTKTFYEPHPGQQGAAARIPANLKAVADNLDGKSMTIGEAANGFKKACKTCRVTVIKDCILVFAGSHCWRVIRFKDPV
jgi:hypothetical protein